MSIKEIKTITGFSAATISRVLSGKAKEFRISERTSRKIFAAAETLDYRPNILAQSLRLRKTKTIGLIVSDIQNPFFGKMASRLERLLRQHGYSTILCNTNEIPENEEFYLKILVDRQVDGIIIAPIHTKEWPYLENLCKDTQVILIDRIFYRTDLPYVTSANTQAAEQVTRDLVDLGHRKIAFLGGPSDSYITRVRFLGYETTIKKVFGEIDHGLIRFKGYSIEAGEEMMENLLELRSDVEAVFCVNNLVYFGAVKVANQFEVECQRRLMMAGFDIGEYCNLCPRPIISADQSIEEMANSAVNLLLDRIARREPLRNQVVIPVTVNKTRLEKITPSG